MNENKTLAIYFENGSTAYFERVTDFVIVEDTIGFKYFGVSSQVKRKAVFNCDVIAGFALEEDGE